MSGEDDGGTLWDFAYLVNEDNTPCLELPNHVDVVDDLFAHIHRGAETIESFLYGDNCPIHACAIATGSCEQNSLVPRDRHIDELFSPRWNQGRLESRDAAVTDAHTPSLGRRSCFEAECSTL